MSVLLLALLALCSAAPYPIFPPGVKKSFASFAEGHVSTPGVDDGQKVAYAVQFLQEDPSTWYGRVLFVGFDDLQSTAIVQGNDQAINVWLVAETGCFQFPVAKGGSWYPVPLSNWTESSDRATCGILTGISNLQGWGYTFRVPAGNGQDVFSADIFICVNAAGDVKGGRFNAALGSGNETQVVINIGTLQPTGIPERSLFTPPNGCQPIYPPSK